MPWPVYNVAVGKEDNNLLIDKSGDTLITDQLTDNPLAR